MTSDPTKEIVVVQPGSGLHDGDPARRGDGAPGERPSVMDERSGVVDEQPGKERLDALNDEINALVAARGDRSAADLVPEIEAAMRREGITPPSRDGVLQWIDTAIAAEPSSNG